MSRKLMELLKIVVLVATVVIAFGVAGYLDRPEDHDDSDAWQTPACYEWLEKRRHGTNYVEKVKTDSTPFW